MSSGDAGWMRRPAGQLALLCGLVFLLYAKALDRYFVSEDFTILRYLFQGDVLDTSRALLTGPWLGLTFVKFYRPLSSLFLLLETLVWGTWSPGYLATHLLIHVANAALLLALVRQLTGRDPVLPWAAALIFAVYPLQPNTVVFIASFATLFFATASLASLLLFVRYRQSGRRRELAGSSLLFGFALGGYEAAAVLPIVLILTDLLFRRFWKDRLTWRSLLVGQAPFAVLEILYFGIRRVALGAVVGGYPSAVEMVLEARFGDLVGELWPDWARLLLPVYGSPQPAVLRYGIPIAVGGLFLAALLTSVRRPERREPGLVVWAVCWICVSQLPYGITAIHPANGRYWYMSSCGLGLLIGSLVAWWTPRRIRRPVVAGMTCLVAVVYSFLLNDVLGYYVRAGARSRDLQQQLVEITAASPPARVFLKDHPDFERDPARTNMAQVYHWGLSDALRPPFVDREIATWHLPAFPWRRLAPLLERPDLGDVMSWDGERIVRHRGRGRIPRRIRILEHPDPARNDFRVRFRAIRAERYRLVVLARGHPAFPPIPTDPSPGTTLEARLPEDFLRSMARLYGSEIFWWIEGEGPDGRPVGFSQLQVLEAARLR